MTVNVLIITHEAIGDALVNAATSTLGTLPLPTTVVAINYETNPEALIPRLQTLTQTTEYEQEVLILTDLFGSTPSNIAMNLCHNQKVKVISGLNLPMLIRVMNYPDLDLNHMAQKALSGGKDGVISYAGEQRQ